MQHSDAPLWRQPVNYGAIGATKADDLLEYPPQGFRPFEQRSRVGHGDARWDYAWQATLSWQVQRGSGFEVELADAPPHIGEGTYTPVTFDTAGIPVTGAMKSSEGETVFGPDGQRFIAPGDTVVLVSRIGPKEFRSPSRVIYVVDEPNRKGFAYGTLPGHPLAGEEAFIVERTPDGSVWLTVRTFSRPANVRWRLLTPLLRMQQKRMVGRYLRSLSGPMA
ncbi:DUF1990 domain-containing protein [Cryobacterium sp. BB307]|uniref:DUF1990 family protein n=1 Tax=Cryobacterium sp. BB307 TaxID=2716317 RepID=UPI001FF0D68D|nr:DUF1990 domain-containing protein [Cryobacterium sp. BB307]